MEGFRTVSCGREGEAKMSLQFEKPVARFYWWLVIPVTSLTAAGCGNEVGNTSDR